VSDFDYFGKGRPCPVCGREKDCRQSRDGMVLCHHAHWTDFVPGHTCVKEQDATGAFSCWLPDDLADRPAFPGGPGGACPRRPEIDPDRHARYAALDSSAWPLAEDGWAALLKELGLGESAAGRMDWYAASVPGSNTRGWACHEWAIWGSDPRPRPVAYHVRFPGGTKRTYGRYDLDDVPSRRGVYLPEDWHLPGEGGPNAVYLPEGAGDTLTAAAMGLSVIGRPNNGAVGAETIAALVTARCPGAEVVVLGENDRKDDGTWPGRDGAIQAATALAELLGKPVRIAFPPNGEKDVRDWYRAVGGIHVEDASALGRTFHRQCAAGAGLVVYPSGAVEEIAARRPPTGAMAAVAALAAAVLTPAVGPAADPVAWQSEASPEQATQVTVCTPTATELVTEQEAAEDIAEARRDFVRFPCCSPRPLSMRCRRTGGPVLLEVRCERRDCTGCCSYLNERELRNARLRFGEAAASGGSLWEMECPAECWEALRRRLSRLGADFLKACESGGRFWVCFALEGAPSPEEGPPAPGATWLSAEQALARLQRLLEAYPGLKRPVSTSHGWRLPRAEEGDGTLERAGNAEPMSDETVHEIAASVGAVAVPSRPREDGGHLVRIWRFLRPGGWVTPEGEGAMARLQRSLSVGMVWIDAAPHELCHDEPGPVGLAAELALC
jgi:hypothetical protein